MGGTLRPQNVTLAGTDWDPDMVSFPPFVGGSYTRAFIFDNIVAVYEKNLSLEIE